jgi:hypothetical protein
MLWLSPEYESGGRLAGVDLVLDQVGHRDWSENLLAPSGDWRGFQRFMLSATDLADGPNKLGFGPHLKFVLKNLG